MVLLSGGKGTGRKSLLQGLYFGFVGLFFWYYFVLSDFHRTFVAKNDFYYECRTSEPKNSHRKIGTENGKSR